MKRAQSEGVKVGAAATTFEPDHIVGPGTAPRGAPAAPLPVWHAAKSRSFEQTLRGPVYKLTRVVSLLEAPTILVSLD